MCEMQKRYAKKLHLCANFSNWTTNGEISWRRQFTLRHAHLGLLVLKKTLIFFHSQTTFIRSEAIGAKSINVMCQILSIFFQFFQLFRISEFFSNIRILSNFFEFFGIFRVSIFFQFFEFSKIFQIFLNFWTKWTKSGLKIHLKWNENGVKMDFKNLPFDTK